MDPIQYVKGNYIAFINALEASHVPSRREFVSQVAVAAITGAVLSLITDVPVAITVGVWVMAKGAATLSSFAIHSLAKKYDLKKSNVVLLHAISNVVFVTALIAAAVSLVIFGSTEAAILGGFTGLVFLAELARSAYLKNLENQKNEPIHVS